MCCTSIAPCWEQHAPWGNITYFPQPKNAFKHLHSLAPLELSSCSLPSPLRPRIHVSFLVPPTLPKLILCPLPSVLLPHTELSRSLGVPVLPIPARVWLTTSCSIMLATVFCISKSYLWKSFHSCKLTWLVLGGDPAACSHRVEQFTAL